MAISQKQYERALDLAKKGGLSDEDANLVADAIEEYRRGKPAELSAPKAVDQDQGFGKLARQAQPETVEPGAFDVPDVNQPHPTDTPSERRARRFVAPPVRRDEEAPSTAPLNVDEILARKNQPNPADAHYDRSYKSASQRKELYAPPSSMPAQEPEAPISILHPLDAARAIGQKISQARGKLPTAVGGNVEYAYEPGMDVFDKVMRPLFGDEHMNRLLKSGETSHEYREFADAIWKATFDQAAAEGRPIVRQKYAEGPGGKTAGLAANAMGALSAAAGGADEGLTAGLGQLASSDAVPELREPGAPDVTNQEAIGSAFPLPRDIGQIAGYINPRSVGSKAASLAEKGLAKLGVGEAKSVAGQLAAGAARGAVGSAAASGAQDEVKALSGQSDVSQGDIGDRMKIAALLGLPLGAVGAGGKMYSDRLRRVAPIGEDVGATTSVTRGIKAGPEAEAIRARAESAGVGPKEMLAGEMEGPITKYAKEQGAAKVESYGQRNAAALQQVGDETRPFDELLNTVADAHEKLHGETGALPFVKSDRELRQAIKQMADVELVPKGQGDVSVADGVKRGYDVQGAIAKLRTEGVPVEADQVAHEFDLKVTARDVRPEELDTIVSVLDNANKKAPLHNYEQFQAAARRVRDQFPPEWTQTKSDIGSEAHGFERQMSAIGLGGGVGEHGLTAQQAQTLQKLLASGGQPGRTLATEGPLRSVVEGAGEGGTYKKILAMRQLEQAEKSAHFKMPSIRIGGWGANMSEGVPNHFFGYRADPLLRKFGPSFGTTGAYGPQRQGPTIDEISRMLAGQEEER